MVRHDTRKLRRVRDTITLLNLPLGPLAQTQKLYTANGRTRAGMVAHDSTYCYRADTEVYAVDVSPLDGLKSCRNCYPDLMDYRAESWARIVVVLASAYDETANWHKRFKDGLSQKLVTQLRGNVERAQHNMQKEMSLFARFVEQLPAEHQAEFVPLHRAALDAFEQVNQALPALVDQAEESWRQKQRPFSARENRALAADVAAARVQVFLYRHDLDWGRAVRLEARAAVQAWHLCLGGRVWNDDESLDLAFQLNPVETAEETSARAWREFDAVFAKAIAQDVQTFCVDDFPLATPPTPTGADNPFTWAASWRLSLLEQARAITRERLTAEFAATQAASGEVVVLAGDLLFSLRGSDVLARAEVLVDEPAAGRRALRVPALSGAWLEAATRFARPTSTDRCQVLVVGPVEACDVGLARIALSVWDPSRRELADAESVLAVARALGA